MTEYILVFVQKALEIVFLCGRKILAYFLPLGYLVWHCLYGSCLLDVLNTIGSSYAGSYVEMDLCLALVCNPYSYRLPFALYQSLVHTRTLHHVQSFL